MDNYRTNFEKIKSSGMSRMLEYINNSNSVIRDVSNQQPNSLNHAATPYEQTCVLSNAKSTNSYLDTNECVKIPDLILSDPTNLLLGLQIPVRNPLDIYRLPTTNFDQKNSKSRFLAAMTANLNTLSDDINYDTSKTNLVSLAKEYASFVDMDNITKSANINPLIASTLPVITHAVTDENFDPRSYYMNLFEPATINPDPDVDQLLLNLVSKDSESECKLIPQHNAETKEKSKLINIKGSTIKPKILVKDLGVKNSRPVVYGLSCEHASLPSTPTNIASGTQTEMLFKTYVDQRSKNSLNNMDKSPISPDGIISDRINSFSGGKVKIGYRDTFDLTSLQT